MQIYLTGFMGSGKTTYGRRLARQINHAFLDLDQRIEETTGKTVNELFEEEGEEKFRRLETETLRKTGQMQNTIIATGGGAPCHDDNMQWMNERGITVYLCPTLDQLHKRLMQVKKDRPLLKDMKNKEIKGYIRQKLNERSIYYLQAQIIMNPSEVKPAMLKQLLTISDT